MTFVKYWLTFPDIGLCLLVVDLHLYNLIFRSIYMAVIDPYLDLFNGCRKWSLILWQLLACIVHIASCRPIFTHGFSYSDSDIQYLQCNPPHTSPTRSLQFCICEVLTQSLDYKAVFDSCRPTFSFLDHIFSYFMIVVWYLGGGHSYSQLEESLSVVVVGMYWAYGNFQTHIFSIFFKF